jgi:hypothetical protein
MYGRKIELTIKGAMFKRITTVYLKFFRIVKGLPTCMHLAFRKDHFLSAVAS